MRLSALAGEAVSPDPDIAGLTADSRAVGPGFLFAALPGVNADGAQFIPQAEEKGAAAVLARPGTRTRLPLIADPAPRRRLARMAARFYPRQPGVVAGITGTNGKTSVARFAAQLWAMLGEASGSLGTLGAAADGFERKLVHTTPEPVELHRTLNDMAGAGATHLAMEISSHALAQHRADGVRVLIAAFTNITRDHLDYHADFEAYFAAKARLFTDLVADGGAIVVNMDGEGAERVAAIARRRSLRLLTTGAAGDDLRLASASPHGQGLDIEVCAGGRLFSLRLPLVGAFQAENAAVAAGIVMASGASAADVLPLLERLQGAPGRMEFAGAVNGAGVYVDYAHTPDAVATALKAVRAHADKRLIVVLGAGGDRDRAKRALMGRAARDHADAAIVTDDNPRTEDPAAIRAAVREGCPDALDIGDRGAAIETAVAMAGPGDIVLIAGKGHETGQQVDGETLAFNDMEAARAAIARRMEELGR